MTTMLDAATTAMLVVVIRTYQDRVCAGVLAISHDTVLLNRWADQVLHLSATGIHAGRSKGARSQNPD
ncbi:hypothetical protein ACLMAJ_12450 [Nocardia sp. KC 131]|uniref:hypothetical protein n=1 Tax=Nocardia arseniciresistens TaxID=3392119 RepID=UPI00398F0B55